MPKSRIRRYIRHGMLPQLAVFEAISRLGSYTRAAEELHLAQPTVSTQMKKLTDALGVPLLEHSARRVEMTEAGRELVVRNKPATIGGDDKCELVLSDKAVSRQHAEVRAAKGGLFVAAVAVGIARGAVGDVAELARLGKRPAFSTDRLADAPVFQDQLGEAELLRHAARALLYERVDAALRAAADGGPDPVARATVRATGPLVVDLAHQVVRRAFALAGGSAVYSSHPLQRRLRDVQTAQQHFTAGRDFYRPVGALLAGADPGRMLR